MKLVLRCLWMVVLTSLLTACGSLLPSPPPTPSFYTLGRTEKTAPLEEAVQTTGPVLLVNPMRAASGYDSTHMIYTQRPQQIEQFARNEWVDTPARMLASWLVQVLSSELTRSALVGAVLLAPSSAVIEYVLDADLIQLQQDFGVQPSQVRLTLRVALIQTKTRRVMAVREFDATEPAKTDDPRGGAQAAQTAVARVLLEVAEFCKLALQVK